MIESKLFDIVPVKVVYRFLFAISLLTVAGLYWFSIRPQIQLTVVLEPLKQSDKFQQEQIQREFQCTLISQSVNELDPFHQERFWYDLVVNQNISSLNQLPIHILQSHGCFWLTQIQIFREENDERKVKCLSEIMQSQMEKVLEDVNCTNRLTLNCGHQLDCGFGCQLHHRAFCVLVSFTLGIPLIHDLSVWPFKSSWESMFKRLGSGCQKNNKTIQMTFHSKAVPSLKFPTLCSNNSCVTGRSVHLHLNQGVSITKELFDILKATKHQDPFLWYMGQFLRYSFRLNEKRQNEFKKYEKDLDFNASLPVLGIQARRTDKVTEDKNSYHSNDEYKHIFEAYFKMLGNPQDPKTAFVASDDRSVLADFRNNFKLPSWRILGFDAKTTMSNQKQRSSDLGLISIVRDIHFLGKCNFVICGLSSNICRLILEMMATQFPNCNSKLYSLDGSYAYPMWGLGLTLKLAPV